MAVATRELALDKGAEEGQAKADVRRYKKKCTYASKRHKKKIAALLLLEKTPERQDLRGTGPL